MECQDFADFSLNRHCGGASLLTSTHWLMCRLKVQRLTSKHLLASPGAAVDVCFGATVSELGCINNTN